MPPRLRGAASALRLSSAFHSFFQPTRSSSMSTPPARSISMSGFHPRSPSNPPARREPQGEGGLAFPGGSGQADHLPHVQPSLQGLVEAVPRMGLGTKGGDRDGGPIARGQTRE